jgi:uncharacterized membrane protein
MILMAIDHASASIARQHAAEFWSGAMSAYDSAFPFLTRLITHLCAPGFFFLMGAGIYWMSAARLESGAPISALVRRTALRGFAIFLIGQLLEAPVMFVQSFLEPPAVSLNRITAPPPGDGTELYWGLITLSGLGMVMMVCAMLLRFRPWVWLLVSALCIAATNSLLPASGRPGSWLVALLLAPGIADHVIVVYPVIPWLAAGSAGMFFACWWRKDPARAARLVWLPGAVLLLAGLALRAAGGWGNIRLPRDSSWIEFLNNVKYPPSLVFLCLALGAGLLLIALLARLPGRFHSERSPLIVFGQTPLFFYIAHFYLLVACALIFFRKPLSLEAAYLVWGAVLAALYPVCAWYRDFKLGKPRESLWRML